MFRVTLVISLIAILTMSANAEIITPNSDISNDCGPKIKKKDVMVLDLEGFGDDTESAMEFVVEHAGTHTVVSKTPEMISTKLKHVNYDRESGIKRAMKEAAKRGCDLVLVLAAGTDIEGTTNVQNHYGNTYNNGYANGGNSNTSGYSVGSNATIKRGKALVLMGDRS